MYETGAVMSVSEKETINSALILRNRFDDSQFLKVVEDWLKFKALQSISLCKVEVFLVQIGWIK